MRGDRDGNDLGTRTVLNASFTGGPRYMYAHYLDALAICRVHGNPSFFITFTCNAKWPEIQEYMEAFPELTTADRADIVDRMLEQKVHDYVKFVRNTKPFGDISVEDPDGYRIISELMMHGPCGLAYKNAPYMKDGNKCNRNFPNPYSDNTYIDKDGFVHYRRRAAAIDTERQNVRLDNSYVVPYNRTLCMRSFHDIRTVNNVMYPTCRAACEALGLIGGNHEWIGALKEAALHALSEELRKRFVQILIFCHVSDPMLLWHKFWKNMSEDIPRRLAKILQISEIQKNETEMKAGVLFEIELILNSHSRTLKDFGLPMPPRHLLDILQNRILMEERNYERELLLKEKDSLLPKLNRDQKQIFDEVLNGVSNQEQKLIFIYGHGGTGKTFLWKSLACALRSEERIVLAVASSGIASLLLPFGRTTHSRFKIPLNLHEECICSIKKNSQLADLLRECDLIIWDEAPMNDRRCFEALDRCLKDILDYPHALFRGKIYVLHQNMRLSRPGISETERQRIARFSSWLLDIGDGNIGTPDETDSENSSTVNIPDELCIPDNDNAIHQLINFIYDDETFQTPAVEDLQKKVIVCPKNETADTINAHVLSLLNNIRRVYLSSDEATPHGNDGGETELLYPNEYLNTLKFAGLPPHSLELKVGVPIILLRNLNLTGGLCNGTRMIVTQLLSKVIEARIITGTRVSEKVFLPRITLINRDLQMPFVFKRKQFPVKLSYAMTINKSQGQSLEKIGIFLPEPVFAHGQLYVAFSRATSPEGLKILIKNGTEDPQNTTKNIVYKDFLTAIRIPQINGRNQQDNPATNRQGENDAIRI
ncbi:DNA helicase [Tanacetum coccineum]